MSFWDKLKDIYFGIRIRFGKDKKPSVEIYGEQMKELEGEPEETK